MRFLRRPIFVLVVIVLGNIWGGLFLSAAHAQGTASIYLSPSAGTFTVGSTFNVSIYLNTGGQFVNAVETVLQFPPNKLQVVSPTAGKSLIQVWISQPTYSNVEGRLRFQGAIPTPGINTGAGLISTVTFRVKDTGTATIRMLTDESRVLLNDGRGTDILSQITSGVYQLRLPPPAGPVVTSRTNPDQEKWYATKTITFEWETPPDTQGFSYVLNDSPIEDPDDISEGMKTSVVYRDVEDGIHYFHLKALRAGVWGGVTDYGIKVDNQPPAVFDINISPSSYTSNRRPIIDFETTDQTSGVSHYELKFIPLDHKEGNPGNETPFFIEATSPYATQLEIGRYDTVVRAYDQAGNYFQASKRVTITHPLFQIVREKGLRIFGQFTVSWPYAGLLGLILLLLFALPARVVWRWHRHLERELEKGALVHPSIQEKLSALKEKSAEYVKGRGTGIQSLVLAFAILFGWWMWLAPVIANAQGGAGTGLEPPVVTLFPEAISNDEIFYISGRASAPEAEVVVYLQDVVTGGTVSKTITTDATGAWFLSFPSFLTAGRYLVWTQLKVGEELSPPSSRIDVMVAPTAVQIGNRRLSYQSLYLILFLVFLLSFLALLGFTLYHVYHGKKKKNRLLKEIGEAEESIRKGFVVLRRDIEAELSLIRKAKLAKELSGEERFREEKLLKDIEVVRNYIGREVFEIEKAEREF